VNVQHGWIPLASSLGFKFLDRDHLPEGMDSAMAGWAQGFPTIISHVIEGNRQAIVYLIRYASLLDHEQLGSRLPASLKNRVSVAEKSLTLRNAIYESTGTKVIDTYRQLNEAVRASAQPFSDLCELCKINPGEFHVVGGIPSQLCGRCVAEIKAKQAESQRAYEELEAHPVRGTLWGILAALAGGVGWGLFAYFTERIWALLALGIGYLVAWSILRGMGKVSRYGQVLTVVLTLASVFWGDIFYVTLAVAKEFQEPLSVNLLISVMLVYPEIVAESLRETLFTLFFGLIGAVYPLRRFQRKPKPVKVV